MEKEFKLKTLVSFKKNDQDIVVFDIPATYSYNGINYKITQIGDFAFAGCSSLTSITIPNSVTQIGDFAFDDCSSLTNITIPDGVTEIRDGAFAGCSSLMNITIPDSVTQIGDNAFTACLSLTISIPKNCSVQSNSFTGSNNLIGKPVVIIRD